MMKLQNIRFQNVTPPAAIVDNAAFTTASVDTRDCEEAMFIVALGALDIALVVMKLRESDDDSAYVDISGADFSVAPLTLPSSTADNNLYGVYVRCGGPRRRYLDLSLTGGDGTLGTFATVLAGVVPKVKPDTAAERGLAQQAIV